MDRPEQLPKALDKDTLKWLRVYGYTLNSKHEEFKKIKTNLKKWYTYEYYFYVDLDLRKEAEKIFIGEDQATREFLRSWDKRFKAEKKRLIKELHGLEKKGIR